MQNELNIEKFSPKLAELKDMVEKSKLITIDQLDNLVQLKVVKDHRLILKEARINITKTGKVLRKEALDFQRLVLGREKELIAIIQPEEDRLKTLQTEAEEHLERKERISLIPQRRESLSELDHTYEITDNQLIDMDGTRFKELCNIVLASKNERNRLIIEEEKEKLRKEQDEMDRKKEIQNAEDRIRKEEREKADDERKAREDDIKRHEQEAIARVALEEQESKERIAREEQEAKDKLVREEQDRKDKKEQEEIDKKRLEVNQKVNEFLKSHGYTDDNKDDFIKDINGKVYSLFKKVGEITL